MNKEQLWQELVNSYNQYRAIRNQFFQITTREERVNIISPTFGQEITLEIAKTMRGEELKPFFGKLLELATHINANFGLAQELLLRIPNDWLVENIEEYANLILANGNHEEFQMLLGIYREISEELELKLLQWGAAHNDFDIQDLAKSILAGMNADKNIP
jgi:hypothetical protein